MLNLTNILIFLLVIALIINAILVTSYKRTLASQARMMIEIKKMYNEYIDNCCKEENNGQKKQIRLFER